MLGGDDYMAQKNTENKQAYIYPKFASGTQYILGLKGSEWAILIFLWFGFIIFFGQLGIVSIIVLIPIHITLFKTSGLSRESLFYRELNKILFNLETKVLYRDPRESVEISNINDFLKDDLQEGKE